MTKATGRNKNSITRTYFVRYMVVSTLFILALGFAWLAHVHFHHTQSAAEARRQQTAQLHDSLVARTSEAVGYANFMSEKVSSMLKEDIKERVLDVHALLTDIWERESPEKALVIIKPLLRSMRFHNGKGYYFAIGVSDGVGKVIADRPDLEGKNMRDLQDTDGFYFIRRALTIAREDGEGYFEYRFTKPGAEGSRHRKISYIKYFEPLDWYIGTGLYVDDVTSMNKEDVLEWLSTRSYPDEGYIFAGTTDGLSLLGPARGRNMYDLQDTNGVYVVRELIQAAQNGGGFVSYLLPSIDGGPSYPKLSYVMSVPEWGWYVGTGVSTADMERSLNSLDAAYNVTKRNILIGVAAVVAAFLTASLLASRSATLRMHKDFRLFQDFFLRAAEEARPIDRTKVQLDEFDELAKHANHMLEERTQAARALRESESRYRSIFENITDGYFRSRLDGTILLASPSAKRMLGYLPSEDVTGAKIGEAFHSHPKGRHEFREALLRDGRVDNYVTSLTKHDGTELPVEINARVIMDDTDQAVAMEGLFRDISERLKTQEVLVQTEKMMSVGGLAAGMAHEINNPLGGVLQGVQNIQRRLDTGLKANHRVADEVGCTFDSLHAYLKQRGIYRMLEGIRDSGERAAAIVAGMLSFARRSESRRAACNLEDLLEHAIALAGSDYDLKKKYDFKSIEIVREYQNDMPEVQCTATEIEQVLLNLLRNAAHAMTDHGTYSGLPRITLRLAVRGDMATVEVEDNGPGMDEHTRRRAFEPFYTTKPPGQGTGLGLSVSYFIITQNHKGDISVESEPGMGAKFTVSLPL